MLVWIFTVQGKTADTNIEFNVYIAASDIMEGVLGAATATTPVAPFTNMV